MFGKQPSSPTAPGAAQITMFQTIAKMLGVPPDMLASAMQTIATAGDELQAIRRQVEANTLLLQQVEASRQPTCRRQRCPRYRRRGR